MPRRARRAPSQQQQQQNADLPGRPPTMTPAAAIERAKRMIADSDIDIKTLQTNFERHYSPLACCEQALNDIHEGFTRILSKTLSSFQQLNISTYVLTRAVTSRGEYILSVFEKLVDDMVHAMFKVRRLFVEEEAKLPTITMSSGPMQRVIEEHLVHQRALRGYIASIERFQEDKKQCNDEDEDSSSVQPDLRFPPPQRGDRGLCHRVRPVFCVLHTLRQPPPPPPPKLRGEPNAPELADFDIKVSKRLELVEDVAPWADAFRPSFSLLALSWLISRNGSGMARCALPALVWAAIAAFRPKAVLTTHLDQRNAAASPFFTVRRRQDGFAPCSGAIADFSKSQQVSPVSVEVHHVRSTVLTAASSSSASNNSSESHQFLSIDAVTIPDAFFSAASSRRLSMTPSSSLTASSRRKGHSRVIDVSGPYLLCQQLTDAGHPSTACHYVLTCIGRGSTHASPSLDLHRMLPPMRGLDSYHFRNLTLDQIVPPLLFPDGKVIMCDYSEMVLNLYDKSSDFKTPPISYVDVSTGERNVNRHRPIAMCSLGCALLTREEIEEANSSGRSRRSGYGTLASACHHVVFLQKIESERSSYDRTPAKLLLSFINVDTGARRAVNFAPFLASSSLSGDTHIAFMVVVQCEPLLPIKLLLRTGSCRIAGYTDRIEQWTLAQHYSVLVTWDPMLPDDDPSSLRFHTVDEPLIDHNSGVLPWI